MTPDVLLEAGRARIRSLAGRSRWFGICLWLPAAVACTTLGRIEPTLPSAAASASPASTPGNAEVPTGTSEFDDPPPPVPAISLQGSKNFVGQAQAALELLATCAPQGLQTVDRYMNAIQESDRSGMLVDSGIFLASSTTAFAPGYPPGAQVYWFAGAMVHDAHHSEQKAQGIVVDWSALSLPERQAIEADARGVQITVLEECLGALTAPDQTSARHMLAYLHDMQAGVIPCDYCAVEWENRDW